MKSPVDATDRNDVHAARAAALVRGTRALVFMKGLAVAGDEETDVAEWLEALQVIEEIAHETKTAHNRAKHDLRRHLAPLRENLRTYGVQLAMALEPVNKLKREPRFSKVEFIRFSPLITKAVVYYYDHNGHQQAFKYATGEVHPYDDTPILDDTISLPTDKLLGGECAFAEYVEKIVNEKRARDKRKEEAMAEVEREARLELYLKLKEEFEDV